MNASIQKDELFGTNPWSEQKLLNQTFTASERTMNRIDSDINKILSDGYRNGKGINSVRNDITKRFDQLSSWEATRIARTEIHNAHNMGTMDIYQEMGVEYTQWIAAHDARTRTSHLDVDREIIPMGGTYSNGLRYPGDTSGPIEEWINCRCSNSPFVIPDGYIAPSFAPFKEEELIQTLDYWNQNEFLDIKTKVSNRNIQRQTPEKHLNPNNLEFNEKRINEKLKRELPSTFSEESADYLTNMLKIHWDDKIEHGQIFNRKTGKPTSIEFPGNYKEVNIVPSYLSKEFEDMTSKELKECLDNPKKFMVIPRKMEGDYFAMWHHHTRYGLYAPSGEDFHTLMSQPWTDYSLILTQKEVWVIETKGTFDTTTRNNICKALKGRAKYAKSYAKSMGYKKHSKEWWNAVNEFYSNDVENYINNMDQHNIRVYRVIL